MAGLAQSPACWSEDPALEAGGLGPPADDPPEVASVEPAPDPAALVHGPEDSARLFSGGTAGQRPRRPPPRKPRENEIVTEKTPRPRRRVSHYPHPLRTDLPADLGAALEAVADKAGWSVAEAARQCLAAGLPAVRQRLRPSRRPAARPSGVQEGAQGAAP